MAEGKDRTRELEASTLGEVIEYLCEIKPELRERIISLNGELNRFFNFYVNGVNAYFLDGANTSLRDGDEVSVIPALGGG